MVRDRRWSDPAEGDDFSAIHVARSGNGLEDSQSGRVGQGFRDLFDWGSIHKGIFTLADPGSAWQCSFRSHFDTDRNNVQPNS